MSDTVVCEDAHLKRKVVIKSLKPGVATHRLMDELSALSAIRSKHVVQILDVVTNALGDIVGLVEEYIDGTDLTPIQNISNQEEILRALYPIAAGICDIHSHGRVHRDIKPDNMKIDSEGVLKIFDFGLAKIDGKAATSNLYFSPGYSAPEIFHQDASGKHNFTPAVDTFAFGCTSLWILSNGSLPACLLSVPPKLPSGDCDFLKLAVKLPPQVAAMLNDCLHIDANKRPSLKSIMDLIGRYILHGKHKMLLTYGGKEYKLDQANPKVTLDSNGSGINIQYDGLDFTVTAVTGSVHINNSPVAKGFILKGASVIVLGPVGGSVPRASITADVSHPEVVH